MEDEKEVKQAISDQELWSGLAECFNRMADSVEEATVVIDVLNEDMELGFLVNLPDLSKVKPTD